MKTVGTLFLLCSALWATPVSPVLDGTGLEGGRLCQPGDTSLECSFSAPGGFSIVLDIGLFGSLGSGPIAQSIHRTTSLDFTSPAGYLLTRVNVEGAAQYSGFFTSVAAGLTAPCDAQIPASFNSAGFGSCSNSPAQSGTISAFIFLSSQVAPQGAQSDFANAAVSVAILSFDPVPVPEPSTGIVGFVGALFGLVVLVQRNRTHTLPAKLR